LDYDSNTSVIASIILQNPFRPSPSGVPNAQEQRQVVVLVIIILAAVFLFRRYRRQISSFRDWYRAKTRKKFEDWAPQEKTKFLSKGYCLRCGSIGNLNSPKEAIIRGEHVVSGKCPGCGDEVIIRL
jgi:hypothetical protein